MSSVAMTNSSFPSVELKVSCIYSPDTNQKKEAIAIIYVVTSSLSILGAGSVLIFAIWKKIITSPEVHPLLHLALADLILASLWFTGACTWLSNKLEDCFYLDVVAEMAHLASFFLTVNYALTAFIRLWDKAHGISNLHFSSIQADVTKKSFVWLSRICYAVCWLCPVVIMLPLISYRVKHKMDVRTNSCTLCLLLFDRPKVTHGQTNPRAVWWSYGSIALTASLSLSIIGLVLLYFLMLRVYRKAVLYSGVLTDLQRASMDTIRNRIFLYVLVFLVCWSPALVVASCDIDPQIKPSSMPHWFILFVFQGLTAPMQGFFNCIVYGWGRKSFRDASERRPLLLESDEFPSSVSESRRFYYGPSSLRAL